MDATREDTGAREARSGGGRSLALLAGATWVALAVLVVLLARENRALKAALAREAARERESHAALPAPPGLEGTARFEPGARLPPFTLVGEDGARVSLSWDGGGGRTLLLVLAEACPVCPQIHATWQELAPLVLAASVRVLGLQLDGTAELVELPGIPVLAPANLSELPLDHLRTVPLTLLVDGLGTVEWVRYGTLTPADAQELMARL